MWHYVSQFILLNSNNLQLKNFGEFSAETIPASVNTQDNSFNPAKRIIKFKKNSLDHTSPEFIEFLAKQLGKNQKDTEKIIDTFIDSAIEQLNQNKKLELPFIGYIQNQNGNFILHQNTNYSVDPDNFGNLPFTAEPVSYSQKTKKEKRKKPKTKQKAQKQPKKEKVPSQKSAKKTKSTAPKTKQAKNKQKSSTITTIIKIAAIIIIFIALTGLAYYVFYPKLYKKTKTIQTASSATINKKTTQNITQPSQTTTANTSSQSNKSSQQNIDTTTTSSSSTQTKSSPNPEQKLSIIAIRANIPLPTKYSHKYYLIVGSFKEYQNARRFLAQIKSAGFANALIVRTAPDTNRVALSGLDSVDQTLNLYKHYTSKYPGRGIWLLINKNYSNGQ